MDLLEGKRQTIAKYGPWLAYDIKLAEGVFTAGGKGVNASLKRVVQTIRDLERGSLEGLRILDLACFEGQFAIEMALQGAEAVGIEIREASVKKAEFARDALGLSNAKFFQDDVRNLSREKYGEFDYVICSGILYHLNAGDVFNLVSQMYDVCRDYLILDTHVGLSPKETHVFRGNEYHGVNYVEHSERSSLIERAKNFHASIDNTSSFWPTRSSLLNLLADVGFTSVTECLSPPVLGLGDRIALVASKGTRAKILSSDATDQLSTRWPERVVGAINAANETKIQMFARLGMKQARRVAGRARKFVRFSPSGSKG